jgi:hypothetical protein
VEDQQMFEQSQKEEGKELRDKERQFVDWALEKVSRGKLRQNYYKLLKQYEEENVILVKD